MGIEMRTTTTIRIDTEVLKKAQELGINVSKACENCLKQYIQALENARMTDGGTATKGSSETVGF